MDTENEQCGSVSMRELWTEKAGPSFFLFYLLFIIIVIVCVYSTCMRGDQRTTLRC